VIKGTNAQGFKLKTVGQISDISNRPLKNDEFNNEQQRQRLAQRSKRVTKLKGDPS